MKILLLSILFTSCFCLDLTPILGEWKRDTDATIKRMGKLASSELVTQLDKADVASLKIDNSKIIITEGGKSIELKIKSVQYANFNAFYSIVADDFMSPTQGGTEKLMVIGVNPWGIVWHQIGRFDVVYKKKLD